MEIEEIKKRFDNLEEIYKTQLEINLKEEDASVAYTGRDFFSLEQFTCEMQNFSRNKIEFFPTLEQVESNKKYMVLMHNGKLLHTRQYFAEHAYCDSVFVHSEKESWRYHVYINADTFRPIFIEYLSRNEEGSPLQYIEYSSKYYVYDYDYKWEDNEEHLCHVNVSKFSQDNQLNDSWKSLVIYKEGIVNKITNERGDVLYDSENPVITINQAINEVKAQLTANVRKMMEEKSHLFKGKIAFAFFEYVFEAAFPPVLALATQEEANRKGGVVPAHSPSELLYFSERDEYYFDLNCEGSDKFDILNKYLTEGIEYEDAITLARIVYTDICESQELFDIFSEYLDITDDFYTLVFHIPYPTDF